MSLLIVTVWEAGNVYITYYNKQIMQKIIKALLAEIGDNVNRNGLKETPERVARMYKEFFYGYDKSKKPKITVFKNERSSNDQVVIDKGYFYSFCEHHMIPFFGDYCFAYVPDKKIIGLSKISRVVDYCASKLQLQEKLTTEIADELERALKPRGLAIIVSARHLCKEMRGVRKNRVEMITSDFRGIFNNSKKKRELLDLITATNKHDRNIE